MPPAGVPPQGEGMVVDPDLGKPHHRVKKHHAMEQEIFEEAPLMTALIAYVNLGLLVVFGYIRDLMRMFGYEASMGIKEWGNEGYPPLFHEFESFYHRNVYHRGSKLTAAPISGVPGAEIDIIEREWKDASLSAFKYVYFRSKNNTYLFEIFTNSNFLQVNR